MATKKCVSCDAPLTGDYCSNCGEKVFKDTDLKLSVIFSQAFSAITNLDNKFLRTMKTLFFKPGRLSEYYCHGERVKFMKPFQIFVFTNLLFFIFLDDVDAFRSPSQWFFHDNVGSLNIYDWVTELCSKLNKTRGEIAILYDQASSGYAKGFIIFLVPFIGFIGWILNLRKQIPFGKHVVFAIHYFSFLLAYSVLWTLLINLTPIRGTREAYVYPLMVAISIYYIIAHKRFYEDPWWISILKGIVAFHLITALIMGYRMLSSLIALYSL